MKYLGYYPLFDNNLNIQQVMANMAHHTTHVDKLLTTSMQLLLRLASI